jgi:hypothetical protein
MIIRSQHVSLLVNNNEFELIKRLSVIEHINIHDNIIS